MLRSSDEANGNSEGLTKSLHPKTAHPDFLPPDVKVGDGPSGQRNIFGKTFSDPKMAYSEYELRCVNDLTKLALDIDSLLHSSGVEETQKLRFIQGCEWKLEAAADALRDHLNWRASLSPGKSTPVLKGHGDSFIYWHGNDKQFRPILLINCKKLNEMRQAYNGSNDFIEKSVITCMSYFMTHLVHPGIIEQIVVIVDLNQCNAWDAPLDFVQRIAKLLTSNFRARLNKLFVINTPLLFYAFWRAVKYFLTDRTASKVLIYRGDYMKALLDCIELQNLDPDIIPDDKQSLNSSRSSDST